MGGVGGTYNLMGGGDTTSSSPVDQNGFLGSRAALPEASGTPTSEADFSTWLASIQQAVNGQQGVPMAAPTTDAGNPLVANPTTVTGFAHADYPAPPVTGIEHISGAAPAPPPVVDTTPKEFAAPTSFAKPWDAMIGANGILSSRGQVGNDRNWNQNPEAVRQWLQAFADSGGDYRVQDQYYNLVSPGAGMKIYWPGDPARPKEVR